VGPLKINILITSNKGRSHAHKRSRFTSEINSKIRSKGEKYVLGPQFTKKEKNCKTRSLQYVIVISVLNGLWMTVVLIPSATSLTGLHTIVGKEGKITGEKVVEPVG